MASAVPAQAFDSTRAGWRAGGPSSASPSLIMGKMMMSEGAIWAHSALGRGSRIAARAIASGPIRVCESHGRWVPGAPRVHRQSIRNGPALALCPLTGSRHPRDTREQRARRPRDRSPRPQQQRASSNSSSSSSSSSMPIYVTHIHTGVLMCWRALLAQRVPPGTTEEQLQELERQCLLGGAAATAALGPLLTGEEQQRAALMPPGAASWCARRRDSTRRAHQRAR